MSPNFGGKNSRLWKLVVMCVQRWRMFVTRNHIKSVSDVLDARVVLIHGELEIRFWRFRGGVLLDDRRFKARRRVSAIGQVDQVHRLLDSQQIYSWIQIKRPQCRNKFILNPCPRCKTSRSCWRKILWLFEKKLQSRATHYRLVQSQNRLLGCKWMILSFQIPLRIRWRAKKMPAKLAFKIL